MIVVKVELHAARTGRVTELARLRISNRGDGTATRGNYDIHVFRGRSTKQLDQAVAQRLGVLMNWPRLQKHVWALVFCALIACGYDQDCKDTGAKYGRVKT